MKKGSRSPGKLAGETAGPNAATICAVAGGIVSVVLSEPSGGNPTSCGPVHGATAGQSDSGGSASRETASSDAITAAKARSQWANLFIHLSGFGTKRVKVRPVSPSSRSGLRA